MLTGFLMGRWPGLVMSDDVAWDHVEPSAPANLSPAGGGGGPAPSPEAHNPEPTDKPTGPADGVDETDGDPFDPVITTAADDADDDRDPVTQHPRFKALRKQARKHEARLKKLLPLAGLVKGMSPDQVHEFMAKARQFDTLASAADSNPRLRAFLFGDDGGADAGTSAGKKPPAGGADFEDLTEDSVPFEATSDVGRFMLAEFRRNRQELATLRSELARAAGELTQFQNLIGQRAENASRAAWKTAVEAAAKELPEGYREMFMDAIHGAYSHAKARGLKITPQQAIDHYLNKARTSLRLTAGQQQRASGAAAQSMAEHNRILPRQSSGGSAPSSVRTGTERVADVSRRIRRWGG